MLNSLFEYTQVFARIGYEKTGRMKRSLEEHRDIAIAVRDGEVELAEDLTKVHIENSKKSVLGVSEAIMSPSTKNKGGGFFNIRRESIDKPSGFSAGFCIGIGRK
jgi:hypothetical protein